MRKTSTPLSHVKRLSKASLPTLFGDFTIYAYQSHDGTEHVALVCGNFDLMDPLPIVRVHSECLTGDIFASKRCDCGPQLQQALKIISASGKGALVYLRGHEGRGIGLGEKLKAYCLQDQGLDTVEANIALGFKPDCREYDVAASILLDLGINSLRLLTNNPEKQSSLEKANILVAERIPLIIEKQEKNASYLEAKKKKLGHLL